MRADATEEHSALNWVKKELDAVLNQARLALESYAEDPSNQEALGEAEEALRQVHGTLQMVELYGAAMLTEEMQSVVDALRRNKVSKRDEALEVMMRAMLQLPDYLEHVQAGHRDAPIALLPLLNDLRTTRGEGLLSENVLFFPDLRAAPELGLDEAPNQDNPQRLARSLRHAFQMALLGWFRDKDPKGNLERMLSVFMRLRKASSPGPSRNFWWIAGALSEALVSEGVSASVAIKQLFGRIDRLLKYLIAEGEDAFANAVPSDLTRNLLYYVATASGGGEQVRTVKEAYKLDQVLPQGGDVEQARESLGGANLSVLNSVSQALREDIAEIKDGLELYVHGGDKTLETLRPLGEKLQRVADTMAMLGLASARQRVLDEASAVTAVVEGRSEPNEGSLLEMAGTMLEVESLLDEFVASRAGAGADLTEVNPQVAGLAEQSGLSQAQMREVVAAAIREMLTDINRAKEAILEYVSSPGDSSVLRDTPGHLERIRGALKVVPLERLSPVIESVRRYVAEQLLQQNRQPSEDEMESLADAITSVEFYLESLSNDRGEYTQIIDVGRASVAKLGYPVDRESTATVERIRAREEQEAPQSEPTDTRTRPEAVPSEPVVDEREGADVELEPESVEVEPEPEGKERPVPLAGEIDDEILEIFLEEANEEVERIGEFLPKWEKDQDDEEALVTVRRSFHTLKGSGRLVGAQLIGEFAWAFENLLNRVIDRTVAPGSHVLSALHQAVEALPQLVAQVRGEGEPSVDIFSLMDSAEAMAKPGYVAEGELPADTESRADLEAAAGLEEEAAPDESTATAQRPEPTALPELTEEPDALGEGLTATMPSVDALPDTTVEVSLPEGLDVIQLSGDETLADLEAEPALEEEQPRIDPVLFGIFRNEAEQHLQVIEDYLNQDQPELTGLPVTAELLRALHTLNGSARTADVAEISEPYNALEHYARVRQGEDLVMPVPALALLERAVVHAREVLDRLSGDEADLPPGGPLRAEVDALMHTDLIRSQREAPQPSTGPEVAETPAREVPPPPSPADFAGEPDLPGEQDMELVEIFLEEAVEIMDASDGTLRRWQEEQENPEVVSEFQRQLHTLKGGARMAGFKNIGNLSHSVESLTIAVVEGEVSPSEELFAKLNEAMDRLSSMLETARNREPVPAAPELLASLEAIRLGRDLVAEPETAPGPEVASTEQVSLEPVAETPVLAEPAVEWVPESEEIEPVQEAPAQEMLEQESEERQAVETRAAEESPAAADTAGAVVDLKREREARAPKPEPRPTMRAAPQELIRVRSDLLDSLVNHAGEVNIYHSRLEQQISGFRFNLSELAQTIHRLREQLRKLEIETEAQIRFSYEKEREHDAEDHDADFDPLELDRYSTIQQLSRALAESWNDLVSIQEFLSEQVRDAETLLLQQSRVSTDLQEGLMRTRMVQFTGTVPRLRRVVRQTAAELGKRVDFDIMGETNELDRSVMERMVAPLEHMLRNAIAHGIEPPEERKARGKSEAGRVIMELGREGSEVVIRVSDDGAGVDLNAVRAKARKVGLLTDTDKLSDNEVMQFILESGFSTAKEVSQIAGRGVGMDVVNNEIKQLNGVLRIDSVHGEGTTFTIRLPFTLAINQALLVRTAEDIFAIPLTSIEGIVRSTVGELRAKYATETPFIEYAANTYELQHLGVLLGVSQPNLEDEGLLYPVLLVRSGEQRIALQVESLLGSREVVVKSVGPQITQARGISGATILGDGRVVLILDIPGLVRMGAGLKSAVVVEPEELQGEEGRPLTVMVVDDSITIRKVTARMLERNNFSVLTAKDGVDAVAQLQDQVPDLMLLDIEMPRMDGYELAQHVRNDERLKKVPIIMITSRTGEKHRQRALDIGVDRYLGKPYQESDLLENINDLLQSTGQLQ